MAACECIKASKQQCQAQCNIFTNESSKSATGMNTTWSAATQGDSRPTVSNSCMQQQILELKTVQLQHGAEPKPSIMYSEAKVVHKQHSSMEECKPENIYKVMEENKPSIQAQKF
jgi:hypothetical protein